MSVNLTLALTVGVLVGVGVYLLLQRTLTRVVLGLLLVGHAANLLLLMSGGRAGEPPLLGTGADPQDFADPLPQAMVLTAVVITFGTSSFLLALAFRSWMQSRADEVQDDVEDRRVAAREGVSPLPDPPAAGYGEQR